MVKCSVSRKNGNRCFRCGDFAVQNRVHSLGQVPHTSAVHVRSTVVWWRRVCCGCRACSAAADMANTRPAQHRAHDAQGGRFCTHPHHIRTLSMTNFQVHFGLHFFCLLSLLLLFLLLLLEDLSSFWQATHTQAHTLITTGVCVNFVYTVRGPTPTNGTELNRIPTFSIFCLWLAECAMSMDVARARTAVGCRCRCTMPRESSLVSRAARQAVVKMQTACRTASIAEGMGIDWSR